MNIIPFRSQDFFIRALDIEGEPWFIGKDVAEALGYKDPTNALKLHCKGVVKRHPLQTAGGMQNVRIINEPDLFRLVVNSRLASAEKFERWVFEEVLPSIRKTGGYQSSGVMLKQTTEAAKSFATFFRALRLIGLDKKAAAISANKAVHHVAGVDLLALSGNPHLVIEDQNQIIQHHTPTALGQMLGGLSGRQVNLRLADAGLQIKAGEHWTPTGEGVAFSRLYDTGKRYDNGTMITQLKWSGDVLPHIKSHEEASNQPNLFEERRACL